MSKCTSGYPLVDLFAGPGGLGEGFAELQDENNLPSFKSVASIERDTHAHQTLLLRHFFHSFHPEEVPESYYEYLAGSITKEELVNKNKNHWHKATVSALKVSLGEENHDFVKSLISQRIRGRKQWALIGGPPCQVYSIVGRSRMMGSPEFKEDKRHFLYKEYLKILIDHKPPVFVMENVKGLLSAKVCGRRTIDNICKDLSSPIRAVKGIKHGLEYKLFSLVNSTEGVRDIAPRAFVVEAEKYGVPQARHRMFILGIRSDLNIKPSLLKKKKPPTLEQVIGGMPKIRSRVSKQKDSDSLWKDILATANKPAWIKSNDQDSKAVNSVIKSAKREISISNLRTSEVFYKAPRTMRSWFYDGRLNVLTSHESRSHMKSDLHRYLFVASQGLALNSSPSLADFPIELLPAHKNVDISCKRKMFADRFRVQLKSKVSTTITSHISKDGHYFIHYDPAQCRSLTVREAARLQTFPDNYFFEGPRTAQYHQVGNAVPPYLALQIAEVVKGILDRIPRD